MSQFTIYKSTDGSAPVLDGTVGSLVNLLDKCLVAGYGAKPAAGWTKPFTGANKAVFRQGGGNQFYFRLADDAPVSAISGNVRGYEAMTDVDTGTAPYPTVAQNADPAIRKSITADATVRGWIVAADNTTCYIFTKADGSTYWHAGFGEIYSLIANDPFRAMCNPNDNSTGGNTSRLFFWSTSYTAGVGLFIARGHTGLGAAIQMARHTDYMKSAGAVGQGVVPFTNPADGGLFLAPYWLVDPTTTPTGGIRGRMRGMWQFLHPVGSVSDGDIFSGVGELSGKTFLVIKPLENAGAGIAIIETSNTLEKN